MLGHAHHSYPSADRSPPLWRPVVWHRIRGAFGIVSAFLSAVCVAYLCALLLLPIAVSMVALGFLPEAAGIPLSFVVATIASLYAFCAFGRLLLRAFPPPLQGKPRYGLLGFLGLGVISYAGGLGGPFSRWDGPGNH